MPLMKSKGGPSEYYDFPFDQWVTTNDMMEYLAEHKWSKYGIHLKDIFKALCRWNTKEGTTSEYDAKKVIYYGVRVLKMIVGVDKTREYLYSLLDDKQFKKKDAEYEKPFYNPNHGIGSLDNKPTGRITARTLQHH